METQATTQETMNHPAIIYSGNDAISVYGYENLSKKDLVMVAHCLNVTEVAVPIRMVVFLKNGLTNADGKPILATVAPVTGVIALNLEHHFARAVAATDETTSVQAVWHMLLGSSVLHEVCHLNKLDSGEEVEQACEDWAQETLWELATKENIEPPLAAESPFFFERAEKWLAKLHEEEQGELADIQQKMLEDHIMMQIPEETDVKAESILTFRKLCMIQSGKDVQAEDVVNEPSREDTLVRELIHQPAPAQAMETQPAPISPAPMNPPINDMPYEDYDGDMYDGGGFDDGFDDMPQPQAPVQQHATPPPAQGQVGWGTPAQASGFTPATSLPVTYENEAPPVPDHGLSEEEVEKIMHGLYLKAYNTIFQYCGFVKANGANYDYACFTDPGQVASRPIQLTADEMKIIPSFASHSNGRWTPRISTASGTLAGWASKEKQLPMYRLELNINGVGIQRLLVPQNPNSRDGQGNYTRTAACARQGQRIMHIIDGNDNGPNRFKLKVVDGAIVLPRR
jgi:hypothetical protein